MKRTPSSQYDLTVGNVANWRNNNVRAFTPERTRLWFWMRDRGGRPARRRPFDLYSFLCVWSERLFLLCAAFAGVGVVYIALSVIFALLSGRLEAIIESIKAAN